MHNMNVISIYIYKKMTVFDIMQKQTGGCSSEQPPVNILTLKPIANFSYMLPAQV
jgi:hypothetical protein